MRQRPWQAGATLLQPALHRLRRRCETVWRRRGESASTETQSRGLRRRIPADRLCVSKADRPAHRQYPCEKDFWQKLAARCKEAGAAQDQLGATEMINRFH